MSFQLCPLCDGVGTLKLGGISADSAASCSICEGAKIIDERTGKPPSSPSPVQTETLPELKPEDLFKPMSVLEEYSEEEILFWHTRFFDELQSRKEAKKKQEDGE